MQWRLPHILVGMALILAAGVLSVRSLEEHVGATSVLGVVVIEDPSLDAGAATDLALRYPGARIDRVPAGPELMSPFDTERVRRQVLGGASTVLFALGGVADPGSLRRAWRVLIHDLPPPPGSEDLPEPVDAARRLARFVREQSGVRPFLAGLALSEEGASLDPVLEPILQASEGLPSFRRTSLVVLGVRDPESGRRLAVRIDRGRWRSPGLPGLADILEDAP